MGALREMLIRRFVREGLKGFNEAEATMLAMALIEPEADDSRIQLLVDKCGSLSVAARTEHNTLAAVMGERIAVGIKAIFQLGMFIAQHPRDDFQLTTPSEILDYCYTICTNQESECLIVIFLDSAYRVKARATYSTYQKNKVEVRLSSIVNQAIAQQARYCFVAHNHPRGTLSPSVEDEDFTRKIFFALKLCGIDFVEHAILTAQGIYSFYEQGVIDKLQKQYESKLV